MSIEEHSDHFILRIIAINSYYFYLIIALGDCTSEETEKEYWTIYESIPGTIVHPFRESILVNHFSTEDTYSIHCGHFNTNIEYY